MQLPGTVFHDIIAATKSKYMSYLVRTNERDWKMTEIYTRDNISNETKQVDYSLRLHFIDNKLNDFHLAQKIQEILSENISPADIHAVQIPAALLHANISAILLLIKPTTYNIEQNHLMQAAIYIMKEYIDNTIADSGGNFLKLISKLKTPVNEIISHTSKPDVIRKSSVTLAVIVNDLIDIYKLKHNKLKIIRDEAHLRQLLHDVAEIVEFKYIVEDDVPETLYIDAKRVKQIILNVVTPSSQLYISSNITIDLNDDNEDSFFYRVEFDTSKADSLTDERLFVTKKLILLMGGELAIHEDSIKFSIEACKDRNTYSDATLRSLKNKKILIIDNNIARRIDIGTKLKRWVSDVQIVSTEAEWKIMSDRSINLLIVGIPSVLDKLTKSGSDKPYIYLVDLGMEASEIPPSRDATPVNSPFSSPMSTPRIRKSSAMNSRILMYPVDESKLLSVVIENV